MMYRYAGDHERGRIMALWSVAFIGVRPIASLVDGAIASLAGTTAATLIGQSGAKASAASHGDAPIA